MGRSASIRSSAAPFCNVKTIKKWPELNQCAEARENFLMRFALRAAQRSAECIDRPPQMLTCCHLENFTVSAKAESRGRRAQSDDRRRPPRPAFIDCARATWRSDPEHNLKLPHLLDFSVGKDHNDLAAAIPVVSTLSHRGC
jgi:hypothetical protein